MLCAITKYIEKLIISHNFDPICMGPSCLHPAPLKNEKKEVRYLFGQTHQCLLFSLRKQILYDDLQKKATVLNHLNPEVFTLYVIAFCISNSLSSLLLISFPVGFSPPRYVLAGSLTNSHLCLHTTLSLRPSFITLF